MSEGRKVCDSCGQTINNREISLFSGMVTSLWEVIKWCNQNQVHEFTRKDIKHLLKRDSDIARFGDWALFGGIVYKRGRGKYGINLDRATMFYSDKLEIPIALEKTPEGEINVLRRGTISNVPNLTHFLDNELNFIAKYN